MTEQSPPDQCASRRGVLVCGALAGAAGIAALAGCSTAAVPYDANLAGVAPGEVATPPSGMGGVMGGTGTMGGTPGHAAGSGAGGSASTGTVLGMAKEIPVGGGTVFMDAKVVVTQPAKGVFKAFSAVCTHVGCVCNRVANGTINCPCHGSEFKITDGSVVTGPAPSPLPARTITVTDGKIVLL